MPLPDSHLVAPKDIGSYPGNPEQVLEFLSELERAAATPPNSPAELASEALPEPLVFSEPLSELSTFEAEAYKRMPLPLMSDTYAAISVNLQRIFKWFVARTGRVNDRAVKIASRDRRVQNDVTTRKLIDEYRTLYSRMPYYGRRHHALHIMSEFIIGSLFYEEYFAVARRFSQAVRTLRRHVPREWEYNLRRNIQNRRRGVELEERQGNRRARRRGEETERQRDRRELLEDD